MYIMPVSNNNQSFQGGNGKKFVKGLKKFCGKVLYRMERSTSRVAESRMGILNVNGDYSKKRIH